MASDSWTAGNSSCLSNGEYDHGFSCRHDDNDRRQQSDKSPTSATSSRGETVRHERSVEGIQTHKPISDPDRKVKPPAPTASPSGEVFQFTSCGTPLIRSATPTPLSVAIRHESNGEAEVETVDHESTGTGGSQNDQGDSGTGNCTL